MADWLVSLAQMVPVAGSYLSSAIQSIRGAEEGENVAQKVVKDWGTGLASGFGEVGGKSLAGAGAAFQYASDKDPTQLLTQPINTGLHAVGIGQEDDEWDKGLLGITGTSFDKIGRLTTFLTLWSDAQFGHHVQEVPQGLSLRKRAWDMAFQSDGNAVRWGEVIWGDSRDLLVNPDALEELRTDLKGTWYGSMATGVLDFAMYAALDPTRGVNRVSTGARASKFVPTADKADDLAKTLNTKLPMVADASTDITPSLGAKAANVVRGTFGQELDDAAVVGNQWKAMGALDDVTDLNQIINYLDPMLGIGGSTPRSGIPAVAEMFRDAARVTSDVTLQRQIKLNVQYALTGSEEAMNWLVRNFPQVAAKGRRVSFAPSEFTLLDDAIKEFEALGNNAFGQLGSPGRFNMGDWITRHYDDPFQQRELAAYGQQVERIQRFKAEVWGGGPGGGAIDFGTAERGLQVAPRNLEKLKTALHTRVLDETVFQDGASGRTMRILGDTLSGLRSSAGAGQHGFISIVDPVHGNRQLVSSLKQYSKQVDGIDGSYIKAVSEQYLKLDPAGRTAYVRQLNNDLLGMVAAKHGMSSDQLDELIRMSSQAYHDGREYASKMAKQAAAKGNPNAYLGDMGGTDTILGVPHLQSHLDETVGLFDFKTADQVAKAFKEHASLKRAGRTMTDASLKGLLAYNMVWKHAQLGRPGLAVRVLLDTDLRANAMIGTAALMMQALSGAANKARNAHGKRFGTVQSTALSNIDRVNAERSFMVSQELRATARARGEQIALRQAQAYRADELAESLMNKVYDSEGKLRGNVSIEYKRRAERAKALANRLAGDTYTVGRTAPKGQKALQKEQALKGPGELQAARAQEMAAWDYVSGSPQEMFANSFRAKQVEVEGVKATFRPTQTDLEWATLEDDVRDSASGLSQLLLGNMDENIWRARQEVGHWADNVEPDSLLWPQKYSKAVQEFRDSYTARRLLAEGNAVSDQTPEAIFKSFLNDPAVMAEFRDVMGGGSREELARWLSDMLTSVRSMAPTQKLRKRLMQEKVLTPDEVKALIPLEERFPIYGPNIVRGSNSIRAAMNRRLDWWYKHTTDMPDVYLGRVPVYNALYRRSIDRIFPGYARKAAKEGRTELTATEMVEIHSRAKQQALNSVHRDMYDIHRQFGVHGVMRYIAPFFNPWFDSMTSWGRLMYDDPSRFGQLLRYAQTPDMFNLTVNKEGEPVRPWDGTPIGEKFIQVPLAGVGGLNHFRLGFGSLNVVAQGNNPFNPGTGPLAQLAATGIVGNVLPSVAPPEVWEWFAQNPDNLISQTFFPIGGEVPRAGLKDLVGSQMPSYVRSFSDAVLGEHGFANTFANAYGTRMNALIAKYREEHGEDPTGADLRRIQIEADNGATAAAFTRGVISFGIGLSGTAAPEGQYYVDKMHALVQMSDQLKAAGLTPEQVFASQYPNYANLNWSYSINEGRLEATVNATSAYVRHRRLMERNPDIMWWIAGPDNMMANLDPEERFSQSAYNTQRTAGLRKKYTQEDLNKQAQIEMAWGKINQFNSALSLFMRQNGIEDLQDANAGDLSVVRRNFMDQVAKDYPEWARSMASRDIRKERQNQINRIQELVDNPPLSLRGRPDVEATAQYLAARNAVIESAFAEGVTGWETAKSILPMRLQLMAFGQQLAAKDLVFGQAWSRLFMREFNDDTVETLSIIQTGQ